MRRLVLFLMIALLAVRGWAGAVMSVEMSVQGLAAVPIAFGTGSVSAADIESSSHTSTDCPDHAAMQPTGDQVADGGSHCNTCVACQICHSVALMGILPLKLPTVGAVSPITPAGTRFASAALRTGFKPPIS